MQRTSWHLARIQLNEKGQVEVNICSFNSRSAIYI
jgi:hypothetical protein